MERQRGGHAIVWNHTEELALLRRGALPLAAESVVHQTRKSIFDPLSKRFRAEFDDVAKEALPQRWIDLIRYLDEKEQRSAESARAETERRTRGPGSN